MESSAWSDSSLRTWLQEFQIYGSGGNPLPTETPTPTPTQTEPTPTPTPGATAPVHVGDLDGSSTVGSKNRWDAEVIITVHDESELPVANATVSGNWSGGASNSATCTTDATGQCAVSVTKIKSNASSVTFSIAEISGSSFLYQPGNNHDPDGDSDGSSITILKP